LAEIIISAEEDEEDGEDDDDDEDDEEFEADAVEGEGQKES